MGRPKSDVDKRVVGFEVPKNVVSLIDKAMRRSPDRNRSAFLRRVCFDAVEQECPGELAKRLQ